MKTTLPTERFSQYSFLCPGCGWKHFFTENQVNNRKFVYVCDCTTAFKPRLTESSPEDIPKITKGEEYTTALEIMKAQGYSVREAKEMLDKVFSPEKDVVTLIKDAIFNGCTA